MANVYALVSSFLRARGMCHPKISCAILRLVTNLYDARDECGLACGCRAAHVHGNTVQQVRTLNSGTQRTADWNVVADGCMNRLPYIAQSPNGSDTARVTCVEQRCVWSMKT